MPNTWLGQAFRDLTTNMNVAFSSPPPPPGLSLSWQGAVREYACLGFLKYGKAAVVKPRSQLVGNFNRWPDMAVGQSEILLASALKQGPGHPCCNRHYNLSLFIMGIWEIPKRTENGMGALGVSERWLFTKMKEVIFKTTQNCSWASVLLIPSIQRAQKAISSHLWKDGKE